MRWGPSGNTTSSYSDPILLASDNHRCCFRVTFLTKEGDSTMFLLMRRGGGGGGGAYINRDLVTKFADLERNASSGRLLHDMGKYRALREKQQKRRKMKEVAKIYWQ